MEFAGSNYPVEEEGKKALNRLLPPHIAQRWIFEAVGRKLYPLFLPVFFTGDAGTGPTGVIQGCSAGVPHPPQGDGPSGGATRQWLSWRCSAPPLLPPLQDLNTPAALFVCSQRLRSWERIHLALAAQKTPFLCRGSRLVCSSAEPVLFTAGWR